MKRFNQETKDLVINNFLIDKYAEYRKSHPCYVTCDNDKINEGRHNRIVNILRDFYCNNLTIKELSLKYETSPENVRSHLKNSLYVMMKLQDREKNPPVNQPHSGTKGMKLTPYGYYLPAKIYYEKYGNKQ